MPDIQEQLFQAVEILTKKQIEAVKFDQTIEATIIDASKSDDGEYIVSTGNAKFAAYSTETKYRENDAVLVTIPQGNYDNQKMIVGKQVNKMNTPMVYEFPFEKIIDITTNLIQENKSWSFYANGEDYCWDINQSTTGYISSGNHQLYFEQNNINYQGYTTIGIQAQFSTWLGEYNTAIGNYGLLVELTFQDPASNKTFTNSFAFDSDQFFGDIYNFESYYTQEQIFDIKDFVDYAIVGIKLIPYQRNNFLTTDGSEVPSVSDDDFSTIDPNIFIKDPYICLGTYTADFQHDSAQLICDNSLIYVKDYDGSGTRNSYNHKHIQLRWIHKNTETNIIKTILDDAVPKDYEIRWYRAKIGAKSPDEFAGSHWERFYGIKNQPDEATQEWAISIDEIFPQDENATPAEDLATNNIQIDFQPNVNRQEEKIKAIIVKCENEEDEIYRLIATSNILVFTNDTNVRSDVTIIDANALSIKYDDDEKGHYFLYNEAGDIGKNEDLEVRRLIAVFDDSEPKEENVYKKPDLNIDDCASIKWYFPGPNQNTMIVPMISDEPGTHPVTIEGNWTVTDSGEYCLTEKTKTVYFTIKSHLNNNAVQNTIRIEIIKDGASFTAQVQPIFGTAGTNGSDYTMVLTWLDGKNALNLSDGFNHTLSGEVAIYDQAGNVIDWPEEAELQATWKVAAFGNSDIRIKEKEEKNIFYPVFIETSNAITDNIQNNPDIDYQFEDFYYFIDNPKKSYQIDNQYVYYYFNTDNREFQHISSEEYNTPSCQWYRKCLSEAERKNKLEYQEIEFIEDPLNQETGETISSNSPITAVLNVENNKYIKQYRYSTTKKYFIKIDDRYILDPWINYQEAETYYEPIEAKEKVYRTLNGNIINPVGGLTLTTNNQIITISADISNINMNSLFILQLTLTNFGDYDLVSYYPIPLKNGEIIEQGQQTFVVDYIEGPDRVRYASSGETDFNKNPYEIKCRQFYDGNFESIKPDGYWKLLFIPDNPSDYVNPVLIESKNINTNQNYQPYQLPLLSPPSLYIPDAQPYGVQFVKTGESDIILWTQPILVYQNNYPSQTLNKWNGKEIVIDENAGTITTSGFSAGKKERDNTFTGVVIGDWSRSVADIAITKNTGIYGFNHGAMAYAFKDDGTGFIGKDGKGRIFLDGNKSQIFSSNWTNSDNQQGMLLDIDDGFIKMQSIDTNTDVYTKITNNVKDRYFSWIDGYYVKALTNKDNPPDPIPQDYDPDASISLYIKNSDNTWSELNNSRKVYPGNEVSFNNDETNSFILSADRENDYYILKWFIANEQHTLNPTYENRLYTDSLGNEVVSLASQYNSTLTYYLKESGTRYITLGSNQPNTPLSIGTEKNVAQRRFRVDWDGTLHVIDGDFKGDISGSTISGSAVYASYLEAYQGKIGGWTIDQVSLYGGHTLLHAYNGIYTDSIKIRNSNSAVNSLEAFGGIDAVLSDTGQEGQSAIPGIAVYCGNNPDASNSILKVTNSNIALRFYGGFMSIIHNEDENHNWQANSTDVDEIIEFGKTGTRTAALIVQTSSVYFNNIAAANQHGIYARFA